MNIETEKLEIISEITKLDNVNLLKDIHEMLRNSQTSPKSFKRVGVVKDFVTYISDDFDDFIPPGFEEYLPTDEQVAATKAANNISLAEDFTIITQDDKFKNYEPNVKILWN